MTTDEGTMKNRRILIGAAIASAAVTVTVGIGLLVALVTWWGDRSDETPEGRFHAFVKWAENGNAKEFADFFPPSVTSPGREIIREVERRDPKLRMPAGRIKSGAMNDFGVEMIRMGILTGLVDCRIIDTVVEGNEARIQLLKSDGGATEFHMVKEGKRWYVKL